jgi:hypothetical protein
MLVCFRAECADVNVCPLGTASMTIITGTQTGADSLINDGNDSTYVQVSRTRPNASSVEAYATVTFDDTYDINKVKFVGGLLQTTTINTIELYYGGAWNIVLDMGTTFPYTTELEGEWFACSGMRVHMNALAVTGDFSPATAVLFFHELYAYELAEQGNYIINLL